MTATEASLFVVGLVIFAAGIILGAAMIHEYNVYLDDHWEAHYSFRDFIKRGRFYIYLFLGFAFVMLEGLVICILAKG